jgi:hypothetical protein
MGDILNVNWSWLNIPRSAKGYSPSDFIQFKVTTPDLVPDSLYVFTTDSSEIYDARGLGALRNSMKVPNIVYPPYAKVIVTGLNRSGQKVEFHGHLQRGATYILDHAMPGKHRMYGSISTENCGCCAYTTSY